MSEQINQDLRFAAGNSDTNMFIEKLQNIVSDEILVSTWKFMVSRIIYSNITDALIFLIEYTGINLCDKFYSDLFIENCLVCNHYEIIKILIEYGLDVNNVVSGKYDYLICAQCYTGNYDIAKLLIENGADVNISGYGALMNATIKDYDNIVQLLIENGADINEKNGKLLVEASMHGSTKVLKLLLIMGINVDFYGGLSLTVAIRFGFEDIAKILIVEKVDVNFNDCSALVAAILYRSTNIVELLLKNGASMNIFNSNRELPVFENALSKNDKVLIMLQESGADPIFVSQLLWRGSSEAINKKIMFPEIN